MNAITTYSNSYSMLRRLVKAHEANAEVATLEVAKRFWNHKLF